MSKDAWPADRRPAGGLQEIGRAAPRADAVAKVTGAEKYAADHYPENCLWVGVKRAAYPHARIGGIDVDAARALPGVVAVLTHRDIRGKNRLGIFEKDLALPFLVPIPG
jgi:CO/xanthine dehydrogenase Mo-binding subunit